MNTKPIRRGARLPFVSVCLLAVAAGLAPAQDPATLTKLRGQYQARCEQARTGYVATLRALHGSLQAAGKEAAAAAVAKELAAAENAMPSATARYVAIEPTPNLRTQSYLMVHELSKPATRVAGLGPDAQVGSTDLPNGRLSVAADFSSELQETPDVFFFDFTGTETFTKENSIRSESGDEPVHIRFGPKVLHLARAGKNIPVCVFGSYSDLGSNPMMDIDLVVAIEANCLFGDRTHAVRLVNGDGRLDFTGRMRRGARVSHQAWASAILIDADDTGTFGLQSGYGQPVLVDGRWYDIVLEGQNISAWPLPIESAEVVCAPRTLSCVLERGDLTLNLSAEQPKHTIPAGDYTISGYRIGTVMRGVEAAWFAVSKPVDDKGAPMTITCAPNKVTELPMGEPLTARVAATRDHDQFALSLLVTDRCGGKVMAMAVPEYVQGWFRQVIRPAPPLVSITDATGKVVYEATMSYGAEESGRRSARQRSDSKEITSSRTWQPPAGSKGRFSITLKWDTMPLETRLESTEVLIE